MRYIIRLAILLSLLLSISLLSAQDSTPQPAIETAPRTEYPVTVDYCGQELTFATPPQRIIASWVEQVYILLSLGLDENILGYYYLLESDRANISEPLRERFEAVPLLSTGGVSNAPSREVVVQLAPDFFYSSGNFDFSEGNASRENFAEMGAVVFDGSNTCIPGPDQSVDMLFDEILTLGIIFDRQAEAQALVQSVQDDLNAVSARVAGLEPVSTFIFDSWGDDPIYVLGGGYWNDVIARAGGINVVPNGNYDGNYDTPPSRELLATVNPEVVFSIAYPGADLDAFESTLREIITNSPAVQNERIVRLPTYPGDPRIAEWVEAIARGLHPEAFETTNAAPRTHYPVTVENCGQEMTITARPERAIVSWGGQAAYMLALGLDDVIIGMYYRFPDEENRLVPPNLREAYLEIPVLGVDGVPPGREVPISLNPDFFYSDNPSDFADGRATVEDFASIEANVFSSAYGCTDPSMQTLEMMFDEILTLGVIFDVQTEAQAVVAEIEAGLQAVEAQVAGRDLVGAVLIEGDSEVLYAAGNGLVQDVFARAGGDNILDGTSYDSPPSREVFATSNPDVILLWDTNVETLPTSFINSVFAASPAVTNQRIVPIRYIGGIGLRVVELADALARAFHPEAFETAAAPRTQYPVTIENCGQEITIAARPERVIASWTGYVGNLLALNLDESLLGYYYYFGSDVDVNPPAMQERFDAITLLGTDGSAPSREIVIPLQPDFFYSGGEFDFAEGQVSRENFAEMGSTIFTASYACLDAADQTIDAYLEEMLTLGVIFDRQAEAQSLVADIREGLEAIDAQIGDAQAVRAIWLDAYSSDPIYPLGNGYYTDVIQRAGGINLFEGATYDTPPSREELAISAPDVVLMITYGDTEALIPDYEEVFQSSPAVANSRLIAGPYFGPLRTVELVEFAARAFHPATFE